MGLSAAAVTTDDICGQHLNGREKEAACVSFQAPHGVAGYCLLILLTVDVLILMNAFFVLNAKLILHSTSFVHIMHPAPVITQMKHI